MSIWPYKESYSLFFTLDILDFENHQLELVRSNPFKQTSNNYERKEKMEEFTVKTMQRKQIKFLKKSRKRKERPDEAVEKCNKLRAKVLSKIEVKSLDKRFKASILFLSIYLILSQII